MNPRIGDSAGGSILVVDDDGMFRESLVQKCEIGINDVSRRQVFLQKFVEEQACLVQGSQFQRIVEFIVVVQRRRGRSVVDLP
jgi:hypothetical protein